MLTPLKQFVCDQCVQTIDSVEDGWLEWTKVQTEDQSFLYSGYRIVHHKTASPIESCYITHHQGLGDATVSDMPLHTFVEGDGLAWLLSFMHQSSDPIELKEIIMRLHMPHYEEARFAFHLAAQDGYLKGYEEPWFVHCVEDLEWVIKEYIDSVEF